MPNKSTEQLIESGKCNIFSECDRKIIFFFHYRDWPISPFALAILFLGTDPQTTVCLPMVTIRPMAAMHESVVGLLTC